MALSDEQLRDEQCKARRLAMLQAMDMIQSQPGALCATCSNWEDKYRKDTQRLFKEVGHLREALQKMVDQLASHMPGEKLRSFLKEMNLDSRIFTIHAGGDFYRQQAPAEEPPAAKERLEDVVSERDVAKMRLSSLSRELREMKSERDALEKQQQQQQEEIADQKRRLALTEEALRVLQEHQTKKTETSHPSNSSTTRRLFDSPGNDCGASLELRERPEPESIEPKLHVLQVRSDLRPLQKLKPQQSSNKSSSLWLNSSPTSQLHGDLEDLSQMSLASLKGLPKQMQTARSQPILWPSKSPPLQRKALPVIDKYHGQAVRW